MPNAISTIINKIGSQPSDTVLISPINKFGSMEEKRRYFFDLITQENTQIANRLREEVAIRAERVGDARSLALHSMRGAQRLVSPKPSQFSIHPDYISTLGGGCVANWLISEALAHRLYEYSHLKLLNACSNYILCELVHTDGHKELHVVTEIDYEDENKEKQRLIIDPLNNVGPIDYETWSSVNLYTNGSLGKIYGSGEPIPFIDFD